MKLLCLQFKEIPFIPYKSRWRHKNPAFSTAQRGIFDKIEAKLLCVKVNGVFYSPERAELCSRLFASLFYVFWSTLNASKCVK